MTSSPRSNKRSIRWNSPSSQAAFALAHHERVPRTLRVLPPPDAAFSPSRKRAPDATRRATTVLCERRRRCLVRLCAALTTRRARATRWPPRWPFPSAPGCRLLFVHVAPDEPRLSPARPGTQTQVRRIGLDRDRGARTGDRGPLAAAPHAHARRWATRPSSWPPSPPRPMRRWWSSDPAAEPLSSGLPRKRLARSPLCASVPY
jgi:hypothetical protein